MTQPAPSFPAFDEWEKMSESEQDALLDKLETKQRGSIKRWVLIGIGLAFAATLVGIFAITLIWLPWDPRHATCDRQCVIGPPRLPWSAIRL